MSIQQTYEQLCEEYDLPAFAQINKEFEISDMDQEDPFPLRGIRRRVIERLETYLKVVEELVQPEGRMTTMMESHVLGDNQVKEHVNATFRELAGLVRQGQYAGILQDTAKEVAFITEASQRIAPIREKLALVLDAVAQYWRKEQKAEDENGYFG